MSDLHRRHHDSVVIYDPASKQLVVRNASPDNKIDLNECPYCHRPLHGEGNETRRDRRSASPTAAASFASPEYFRMLHHSLPGSTDSSGPPSPRRRLTQPVRSGRATPAYPPKDAEFIGSSPASPPSPNGISSTAFSPNYFQRFFVEERELGRGGKGVVLLVKHVLDGVSLGHFACKRVPVGDDHEWLEKVLIEVQLLQNLSHQNLVSYRHVWLEDYKLSNFGPSVPCAFILQQYCNAGDLHNYICSTAQSSTTTEQLKERIRRRSKHQPEIPQDLHGPRKLAFEAIYSFFKDIASGLNHLHVNGYIHRDLKPSNCLLHENANGLRVLVSDFGEVQMENMARRSTGATGTISYCAPEVLRKEHSSGSFGNFTTKSDIFSLGMILYFLCFAQLPYHNADNLNEENEDLDQLRDEITSWTGLEDQRNMRPDLPDKLYIFLMRLLSLNPNQRPSAEDILNGIKTGSGLEENSEARARSKEPMYDDIRTSSRILPMDTPSNSPVPSNSAQNVSSRFGRSGAPSKLRLKSSLKGRQNSLVMVESDPDPINSPGGSLILRSTHSSPMKVPEIPQLLPSPSWRLLSTGATSIRTMKVVFLILKIFSVSLPCMPVAANPSVAFPLFGLATLDLFLNESGVATTLLLMTIHVLIMIGTLKVGVFCIPKANFYL